MIVDKLPLPEDPTPADAPPSYDALDSTHPHFQDVKSNAFGSSSPLPSPTHPSTSSSATRSPVQVKGKPLVLPKSKGPAHWFNFSASRTAREVKTTVLGLIRDIVRQQNTNASASLGILDSCAEACNAYSLSLSSLLQEKSVEGHTPIYWAIIKRPPDSEADESTGTPDLLTALLSLSSPLTPETVSEIRLACLLTSDQPLFQRLRLSPEFSKLSGTDEILLGATMPPDQITVKDVPGDEGAFVVNFEIVQFQKRMRISKEIVLEFIARGRMWRLSFCTNHRKGPRPGSWCISLSLLEHSPPSWLDSRLLIEEPVRSPPSTSSLIDEPLPNTRSRSVPKPTISLRLKTAQQLAPPSPEIDHLYRYQFQTEVVVSLEDSLMGASLQYAGSTYIAADGKLRARLEARLAKPELECIIC